MPNLRDTPSRTAGVTSWTCAVDGAVFSRFPSFRVGAFVAERLDRAAAALTADVLRSEVTRAARALALQGITIDSLRNVPAIQQWRRAFAACGLEPAAYPSSVEAAVRRVLDGTIVARALPAAALCEAVSARRLAPLRGCDLDALPASTVMVRAARPHSDWFVPLGARPTDLPLMPAVIVYAARQTVLSWSFNHAESRQVCLSRGTTRAVFFADAVAPDQADAAAAALGELRSALAARGAIVTAPRVADVNRPQIALSFADAVAG